MTKPVMTKPKTMKKKTIGGMEFVTMPGNMYAHFGLPNADMLKARSDLSIRLLQVIANRKLTQTQVAKLLDVSQPHVSNIMAGKLKKASIESLMGYLNKLGVEINISARSKNLKASARTLVAAYPGYFCYVRENDSGPSGRRLKMACRHLMTNTTQHQRLRRCSRTTF